MYKIYIVRNTVNGKIYVGQTAKSVEERWKAHVCSSRTSRIHFHNAIRKHGQEVFRIKEIDKTEDRQECLNLEKAYILMYMSYVPELGYNTTMGGDGTVLTAEARTKLTEKVREFIRKPEHLAKISKTWFRPGHQIWLGRKHSTETVQKLSQNMTGKKLPPEWCKNIGLSKKGRKLDGKRRRGWTAAQRKEQASRCAGRKQSEQSKIKASEAMKLYWQNKRAQNGLG